MIATAHSGDVRAFSRGVGKGSKFALIFPTTQECQPLRTTAIRPPIESLHCKKLLLVEDNDGAREMLADYLSLEGFEVNSAANGRDAIDAFKDFCPSICIVDIGLPDLNGYEVVKQIRAQDHQRHHG